MNDSLDVSTIIFAALAVFVVWKLRSVLGTRTGEERPPTNPFTRRNAGEPTKDAATNDNGNVVTLPSSTRATPRSAPTPDRWKGIAEPGSALAVELDRIAAADSSFTGSGFLQGAKAAYEMILGAFAKGNRSVLQGLLAADVLEGFSGAIAEREGRGETLEHTMVALDGAKITHAHTVGGAAQVTVRFDSHQINTLKDRQGAVLGSAAPGPVVDEWTFARATSARDPNWTLIATNAE